MSSSLLFGLSLCCRYTRLPIMQKICTIVHVGTYRNIQSSILTSANYSNPLIHHLVSLRKLKFVGSFYGLACPDVKQKNDFSKISWGRQPRSKNVNGNEVLGLNHLFMKLQSITNTKTPYTLIIHDIRTIFPIIDSKANNNK